LVTVMTAKNERRALRIIVWSGRAIGWILIAVAIGSTPQIGVLTHIGDSLKLISSVALAVLGVVWIIGLELFLRFFDKFLSRN
jgi:hypothetical protein